MILDLDEYVYSVRPQGRFRACKYFSRAPLYTFTPTDTVTAKNGVPDLHHPVIFKCLYTLIEYLELSLISEILIVTFLAVTLGIL